MLQGAIRYIDQQFPGIIFSEPFFLQSTPVGTDSVVEIDYSSQGALAVLITSFYWSFTGATHTWNVQDQFKQIIFQVFEPAAAAGPNPQPMPMVIVHSGGLVRISVPSIGGTFLTFSIAFQYLMQNKKKEIAL